jgi:hypothetical protein
MTVCLFKVIPIQRPREPHNNIKAEAVDEEVDMTMEDGEDVVVIVGGETQPSIKQFQLCQ